MFKKSSFTLSILLCVLIVSCGTPKRPTSKPQTLYGQGSSFILPMSSLLFKEFAKTSNTTIDYLSENSYLGIESLIKEESDFALSSIYLTDKQAQANPDVLHIPVGAAGINFAYNIPFEGFSLSDDPIYLTPEIFTKILTKQIVNWNDPEIIAINQKVAETKDRVFPNLPITVIQRSENSGDTYLLTKFLSKATPLWTKGVTNKLDLDHRERSTTLGMMKELIQTPGALTYTTMIYGYQNNIPLIRIRNYLGVYGRGCNFRTLEAMKVAKTNADNRVDLTYPTEGREVAVATGFMYMLVKKEQNYNNRTKEQAQALVDLIDWMLSPVAQRQLEPLFFAALTPKFRYVARQTLNSITYDGEPIPPSTEIKN